MIDPGQLAFDTAGNAISVALPGLLWAALFLFAFERGAFAESLGLGRRAFWLLLPGAVAVTLADLPFVPISNDILGISFGGALFPVLVALLALGALAPPRGRAITTFAVAYGAVAAAALAVVLLLPAALPSTVGVVLVAALGPLALALLARLRTDPTLARVAGLIALTDGVLVLTFLFSSAVPGQGISEMFPEYLLPPVAAGLVAALAAPRLLRDSPGLALPAAYIAGTFGVLVGADVLREPPLYPSSGPGLYVIGGAGVLDLVYLSGLLAFASAFSVHYLLRRPWTPVPGGRPASPPPPPVGQLGRAFRRGVDGELSASLEGSALAARSAAAEAAALLGVPPAPAGRPWQGLPVPGWVVSDQANLDAAAAHGTSDGRESYRGWLTARALVGLSLHLTDRRFANPAGRTLAFVVDLFVVTGPAVLVWTYLALRTGGGLDGLLGSVAFNAAIYAYVSLAYLYFVVGEYFAGTTVGKWLVGFLVRDRHLGPPELLSVLLRNAFRVPTLSIIGISVASAIALTVTRTGTGSVTFEGLPLPAGLLAAVTLLAGAVLATGLIGLIAYLSIGVTSEHQRWGDLVAGTWVVRRVTPASPAPAPPPVPGPSG